MTETTAYAQRAKPATDDQKARIEEYRTLLQGSSDGTGERDMSYGELADLQSLATEGVIDPSDTDMLEAAGVSEWEATGYGEGNPEEIDPSYGPSFFDADEIARVNSLDEDGDPEPPEVDPDA